ncbi:hypothetical protein ACFL2H_13470 [Planctomycetota bacterium]
MSDNTIRSCFVENGADGILVRGTKTHSNTFDGIDMYLTQIAVKARRGPNNNLFRGITARGISNAVSVISHTTTDGVNIYENEFLNCGFHFQAASQIIVSQSPEVGVGKDVGFNDNLFCNCTFVAHPGGTAAVAKLHDPAATTSNLQFVNCIVNNFGVFDLSSHFAADFINCNLWNTPFWDDPSPPVGATFLRCNDQDSGLTGVPGTWATVDFHIDPTQAPGALDRGTHEFQLQPYVDISLILDIDIESSAYDPVNTGIYIRFDIGCDEFYP